MTETKQHDVIEWPVPPGTAKLIEAWVSDWRELLGGASSDNLFLFPGRDQSMAMSSSGLAQALKRSIAREIGCDANPHLFRHFAACRNLRRNPGQYEIVRRALGHSTVETTVAFYCGLEGEAAARSFQQGIEADRVEARQMIKLRSRQKTLHATTAKRKH